MKVEQLNQWLTLVANIGVIAGIVFLAYEINQNTQAIQSASFQGYTDTSIDWLSDLTNSRELADIWYRYSAGAGDLDNVELMRASMQLRKQWFRLQNAYSQWQRGLLDDADWEVSRLLICREPRAGGRQALSTEAAAGILGRIRRESWPEQTPYLNQEFIDFVEGESCWHLHSDN